MNALTRILFASLVATGVTTAFLLPAMAEENRKNGCDDNVTVKLGQMGTVDEEALQKHIDKMEQQMKNLRHGRGSHVSRKYALKQHLSVMRVAVQEIHDEKYAAGCKDSMSDASVETRIKVMEKRMDMMQQMMKQMVEHLSEKPE